VVEVEYVKAKLSELADGGETSIAKCISVLTDQAIRTGNLNSSQYHLFAREELKKGFREVLETMARFLIDFEAVKNSCALDELKPIAKALASRAVENHWVALFGSPAFDREAASNRERETPKIVAELTAMSVSVAEDAKRGIVGHRRYGSSVATEEVVTLKPGIWGMSVNLKALARSVSNFVAGRKRG
jgi:hypothetical protein